jgi:hypothetical protein
VEGFEHRQMMTMMNYSHPYLPQYLVKMGFEKEVDFISIYTSTLPSSCQNESTGLQIESRGRSTLKVKNSKISAAGGMGSRIGQAYNKAFTQNWEYSAHDRRDRFCDWKHHDSR